MARYLPPLHYPNNPHIIIVGAGIAGLTLAIFLAKAQWNVTLCERERELKEVGAGLQLAPNATRILDKIGVMDDLLPFYVEPYALRVWRCDNAALLAEHRLEGILCERYGSPHVVVHRADLQSVLLRKTQEYPSIRLSLDSELVDFAEDKFFVSASFQGADKKKWSLEADLLVGADGAWSRTRVGRGFQTPPRYSGKAAWRTLVPRQDVPDFARSPDINLWLGEKLHVVHYPVCSGSEVNIVAIAESDWREKGWSLMGNGADLRNLFARCSPELRNLLEAAKDWKCWALMDLPSEKGWSGRRSTLIGDAAHAMMPFLAQGASQGVEDAAILAVLLTDKENAPLASGYFTEALYKYEVMRHTRTTKNQMEARKQGDIYHLRGAKAKFRDIALRLGPREAFLRRFDWIYAYDALEEARKNKIV